MNYTADIKKLERYFLPKEFTVTNWETLEPYFKTLLDAPIDNKIMLEQWMKNLSELEAAVNEDACWRQIKMTCDNENKTLEESFNFFCMHIQPLIQPYSDALNKKLLASPFLQELDQDLYFTYLRSTKKSIALFRTENIPLQAELAVQQQQFGQLTGAMSVEVNGETFTLQQAAKFLENEDRNLREEVYRKIQNRRLEDKAALNNLYDSLLTLRNNEAARSEEHTSELQSRQSISYAVFCL